MEENKATPPLVVMLGGNMGAGKSHCADKLVTMLENRICFPFKLSFATPLKDVCSRLAPNADMSDKTAQIGKWGTVREMYQNVGKALRGVNENVFAQLAVEGIKEIWDVETDHMNQTVVAIIDDLRYPNEESLLSKEYDTIKVFVVKSTGNESMLRAFKRVDTYMPVGEREELQHESEQQHDKIEYQYTLENVVGCDKGIVQLLKLVSLYLPYNG